MPSLAPSPAPGSPSLRPTPDQVQAAEARALRLARQFAARMPVWMDADAFAGEALLAVATALRDYDPAQGASFTSWAHSRVRYALLDEQRRQDPVGQHRRRKLLAGELPERPSDQLPLSLDLLQSDRGDRLDAELEPAPSAETLALQHLEREALHVALATLTPREQQVVHHRYFAGLSRPAIARELGISATRVKALEQAALEKLRLLLTPTQDRP